MSLLELTAAVAIVGLMAVMAATRYSPRTLADIGAEAFARRLALDLTQARQCAVALGDNHLIRFTTSGGQVTQYGLYRRQGANVALVDEICPVPAGVTVTTGGTTDAEFAYTGEALASYTFSVQAPDKTLTVNVPQATGKAFLQ